MKKPSERIKEIQEAGERVNDLDSPSVYYKISRIEALIQHLDEEYEKKHPEICTHPERSIENGYHCVICNKKLSY